MNLERSDSSEALKRERLVPRSTPTCSYVYNIINARKFVKIGTRLVFGSRLECDFSQNNRSKNGKSGIRNLQNPSGDSRTENIGHPEACYVQKGRIEQPSMWGEKQA